MVAPSVSSPLRARPPRHPPAASDTLPKDQAVEPSRPKARFQPRPRPETNAANTPEVKEDTKNKVALLKSVLGAYFSEVESELLNNSKPLSDTSEKILAFTETLPQSLNGLADKPRWLLYTSRSPTTPKVHPTPSLVNGSPVVPTLAPLMTAFPSDAANPEEDFATFYTWQTLRLGSALQWASMDLSEAEESRKSDRITSDKVQKERKALGEELETTMVGILEALTKSAVRISWRGAKSDEPAKDGGAGKAREIVEELLRVARALVPSTYEHPSYPRDVAVFESSAAYQSSFRSPLLIRQANGFSSPAHCPSITLNSSLHARCLIIVILRILLRATSDSLFLAEFRPFVIDLLVASWPSLASFSFSESLTPSRKGKERAEPRRDEISRVRNAFVVEWLDLTLELAFDPTSSSTKEKGLQEIVLRVVEELEELMDPTDEKSGEDRMEVDGGDSAQGLTKRIEDRLCEVLLYLYELKSCSDTRPPLMNQVFSRLLSSGGESLVSVLFDEHRFPTTRSSALFSLAYPLIRLPQSSNSPFDLLPSSAMRKLDQSLQRNAECPFSLSNPRSTTLARSAYDLVLLDHDNRHSISSERAALEAQESNSTAVARKRRRLDGPEMAPSSDTVMDIDGVPLSTAARRKKRKDKSIEGVIEKMIQGLEQRVAARGEIEVRQVMADEGEAVSAVTKMSRLIDDLYQFSTPSILYALDTIAIFSCLDASTASSADSEEPTSERTCPCCDSIDPSNLPPIQDLRKHPSCLHACPALASKFAESASTKESVHLAFLSTLQRIVRHSDFESVSSYSTKGPLLDYVVERMRSSSKSSRTAAGHVLLAIVQAEQYQDPSLTFGKQLFGFVDSFIYKSAYVTETTLQFIGRLARLAEPQGYLEGECLARLLQSLGTGNPFLRSTAKLQLAQIAEQRGIRPYALAQPHFAALAPVIVSTKSTLKAVLDCFHQSSDALLRVTREHTIPRIILSTDQAYRKSLLNEIAKASNTSLPEMLCDPTIVAKVVARLYMEEDADRDRGVAVLQRETLGTPISELIESAQVPTVFALALELGDEDERVKLKAERALRNVERTRLGDSTARAEVGSILQNAIVGILSYMNNGLREATSHRPLRDKQKIIRSLSAVTLKVGSGISGFSPQIMATLQTALASPGLRMAALEAFRSFMTSGKFTDIGVFIGPTSASFVHIWPELTGPEKAVAASTLEYIVGHRHDLKAHIHDVVDLSHIPELASTAEVLKRSRRNWTFERWCGHLLERIRSENDVVMLEALKELRALMKRDPTRLQALSFGDSFDHNVGRLVEVLLAAAVKDGQEYADIRNVACECVGLLGAVDPDRFEIPPAEPPFVVLENFDNHDESIRFALRLIQDLLVGAYRSTNDTKHQEFLAFAIQELLRFCGFNASNAGPGMSETAGDQSKQQLWQTLPENVKQACAPLLSTQFGLHNLKPPPNPPFPLYLSTSNYRDWSRCLAYALYRKIQGTEAKEIFCAFDGLLQLEDTVVAQYLLPHLVLNVLICGSDADRTMIRAELEVVLTDQVSPTHNLPENSRLLAAQTVFSLMDHLSRWITLARKRLSELKSNRKKSKTKSAIGEALSSALLSVEGLLQDIPQILVGQAALTCKSYARSLLNFESHIIAQRAQKGNAKDKDLQAYYENLHECYADLDEPDGMEGISTKILAPSILHQIREHESTGRWTSAQSCWEVKLQQKPDDPDNHVGLLRCLRNLGHYDSMRTHIAGLLSSRGDEVNWERILAPFNIEASLFVSDWDAVEDALEIPDLDGPEASFGRVLCAMKAGDETQVEKAFFDAREQLGGPIVAAGRESYRRVYDSIIHLHVLHELKEIHLAQRLQDSHRLSGLVKSLRDRLNATSPSFRAREPILNLRRTAFRLASASNSICKAEIGELWLETSKIARKAGHSQTAYSAILQARDCSAKFAFYQSAKLLKAGGQTYKAIQELDNRLTPLLSKFNIEDNEDPLIVAGKKGVSPLAKASLRRARWMLEAGRVEQNNAIALFMQAGALARTWESPLYYLGHYWDQLADAMKPAGETSQRGSPVVNLRNGTLRAQVVRLYYEALSLGTKFIYQALPRMLTIWLEMSEAQPLVNFTRIKNKDPKAKPGDPETDELYRTFQRLNDCVATCAGARSNGGPPLPVYQWLTVLPQLVSRILHPNLKVVATLEAILTKVLQSYPHHGFWAMASGAKSMASRRSKRNVGVFNKAKEAYLAKHEPGSENVVELIDEGLKLVDQLLYLCDYSITGKVDTLSMQKSFPGLHQLAPSKLMIPLQNSLTVSLPFDASRAADHKPFPDNLPSFHAFEDQISIMSSLQKPRKITVRGTDGRSYSFLCKPKDDLRKDARLMEFNAMIIKLLKKDSEARSRKLDIRTYSVVPLNEECGLIEWVPHVVVLRGVLNKAYSARGIASWSPELKKVFDTIRDVPKATGARFENEVLSAFPPVFHDWFLENFPEPSAWHRARLAYSRTAAVISMVGFVLGLGDRHCENILLDGTTGDTVHVDFNCLFDKGRTFEVAEKVPFRLTANIIDGMGVTGVEGVYRRSAEIALRILRANQDSLRSVLETFLHDPLVEWIGRKNSNSGPDQTKAKALESLEPISNKLRGLQVTSDPASLGAKEVSVEEQVERLIREARDPANLGSMYVGWCAWY